MLTALSFWTVIVLDRFTLHDVARPERIRGGQRIGIGVSEVFADDTYLAEEVRSAVEMALSNPRARAVALVETTFVAGDETRPPRWTTRATEVHDLDALRALETFVALLERWQDEAVAA